MTGTSHNYWYDCDTVSRRVPEGLILHAVMLVAIHFTRFFSAAVAHVERFYRRISGRVGGGRHFTDCDWLDDLMCGDMCLCGLMWCLVWPVVMCGSVWCGELSRCALWSGKAVYCDIVKLTGITIALSCSTFPYCFLCLPCLLVWAQIRLSSVWFGQDNCLPGAGCAFPIPRASTGQTGCVMCALLLLGCSCT